MPYTDFPNGATSFGIPLVGGMLPPFTGHYFWVNETTGSNANDGSAQSPFNTLAYALTQCTSGNNDVIFMVGTQHVSSTLAWNLDWTHLVGVAAPGNNPRARISQTGSSVFTPLVNVTGQGCWFINFSTFHGFANASSQICWTDAGGRNAYQGVQFLGMGNATAAAQAGGRSLLISGSTGENRFDRCTIGLDTITRSTTNASLQFSGNSPRNEFRNCVFRALTSAAGALHCTIGAAGIDRYALFDRCTFLNSIDSTGVAMDVGFVVNAAAGGSVLLQDCSSVGATVYATTGPIYVTGAVPTGNTTGLAVAAT